VSRPAQPVGAILVTGSINLIAIVGIDDLAVMFSITYGWMLMLKLALFFGMLGLAAFNRWQLVPSIRAILGGGGQVTAVFRLWRAIMAETPLGFRLLAVVAILRTLSPGD
jgi:putative copper resistance protein D